jgi:ech hydrogenase subunit A
MAWLVFLIAFPLLPACLSLFVKQEGLRNGILRASAAALAAASLVVAGRVWSGTAVLHSYHFEAPLVDRAQLAAEWILYGFLFWRSLGMKKGGRVIPALLAAQLAVITWFELGGLPKADVQLCVDHLSALLLAIVGVVGGLVAVFAIPYMKEYQEHHPFVKDRRGLFFFLIFLFLSAMNGIVLCNAFTSMLFFWEMTTLCSYLLIRYSGQAEAVENSDLALALNVVGGVLFTGALLCLALGLGPSTGEMSVFVATSKPGILLPAVLLGAAGMVKAAQMPFQRWLLGAMVAPTPVSALLHSSTMVKAGVFLLLRVAPLYTHNAAGPLLAGVGGISFLACSLLAITESDGKRVLAYSTIANLGLITACAGVGTAEALWAGMLLLLFHAVAKALLFLAVGSAEHSIGSRSIEDMGGLLYRSPVLAAAMLTGILGMFLAPFGMLVAKWQLLHAFATQAPLMAVVVAFGSAPTLFFWGKWLGKLVQSPGPSPAPHAAGGGWVLLCLAGLTVAATGAAPLISSWAVEPHLLRVYGWSPSFQSPELTVLLALGAGLLALPLFFAVFPPSLPAPAPYLAGANAGAGFSDSMGRTRSVQLRNYYLHAVLLPRELELTGAWAGGLAMALAVAMAVAEVGS